MPNVGSVALGDPPAFGSNCAWPPLQSSPTLIAKVLIGRDVYGKLAGKPKPFLIKGGPVSAKRAVRLLPVQEIVYSQFWQREDPVVQLPPGASHELKRTTTYGVAQTEIEELAKSLGLTAFSPVSLSAQLASRFGLQTTLSVQKSVENTVTLQNDGEHAYRLFALWSVRHEILVQRVEKPLHELTVPLSAEDQIRVANRTLLNTLSYESTSGAVLTSCEIER